MAADGVPGETELGGQGPARPRRPTTELIVELRVRAAACTLAAIAVAYCDTTRFVFATDEDPLADLNELVAAGGHPIGVVGARVGGGVVEYCTYPFAEYREKPDAVAYLQALRVPFLTLLQTHIDRLPDDPRRN